MHPVFSGPYFGPDFFSGSHTDPCFQNKNSGCRLIGKVTEKVFTIIYQGLVIPV
jgi:hypothetical protein